MVQVILTRPRKEPALGQGVIIPLSEPLAALQESPSHRGTGRGTTAGQSVWRPGNTCSALAHKSDRILAWNAEVIIWDNQAFTSLMLKKKAVYGNEGWWLREPLCDCSWLIIHRIAPWSLLQKRVTDMVNTHLRRIYGSRHIARKVKHVFYDWYDKGRYQLFYVWHL